MFGIISSYIGFYPQNAEAQVKPPKHYRKGEDKLKNSSKSLSRKVKGSTNRNKQRDKVVKIHRKIRNQRKDYSHKISMTLVDSYDKKVFDKLQIQNMVKKTLAVRVHSCPVCGLILDRDHNAAINILNNVGQVMPDLTPVEMFFGTSAKQDAPDL